MGTYTSPFDPNVQIRHAASAAEPASTGRAKTMPAIRYGRPESADDLPRGKIMKTNRRATFGTELDERPFVSYKILVHRYAGHSNSNYAKTSDDTPERMARWERDDMSSSTRRRAAATTLVILARSVSDSPGVQWQRLHVAWSDGAAASTVRTTAPDLPRRRRQSASSTRRRPAAIPGHVRAVFAGAVSPTTVILEFEKAYDPASPAPGTTTPVPKMARCVRIFAQMSHFSDGTKWKLQGEWSNNALNTGMAPNCRAKVMSVRLSEQRADRLVLCAAIAAPEASRLRPA